LLLSLLRFSLRERRTLLASPMSKDQEDLDQREPILSELLSPSERLMLLPSTLSEERLRRVIRLSTRAQRFRDLLLRRDTEEKLS